MSRLERLIGPDGLIVDVRIWIGPELEEALASRRAIRAVGVTVVSPGAIVLIGRDLLATCRFTYDGRKHRLMMSY